MHANREIDANIEIFEIEEQANDNTMITCHIHPINNTYVGEQVCMYYSLDHSESFLCN